MTKKNKQIALSSSVVIALFICIFIIFAIIHTNILHIENATNIVQIEFTRGTTFGEASSSAKIVITGNRMRSILEELEHANRIITPRINRYEGRLRVIYKDGVISD